MVDFDGIMGRQSKGAKLTLVVAIFFIFIVFAAGLYWALTPRYEVLFDSLETTDLGTISAELDRQGYQYRTENDAIKVPEKVLHEARLSIMETGIRVKGAVGYELFDNSDFGMTEFAQRINYQRAVEGELTRTIMALEAVKWARVHIVMPEKQLFSDEEKGPTASVILFVRNGEELNQKQVNGIQRLVASSVRKLESKNVSVLEQNGMMLSNDKSSDTDINDVNERRQHITDIEEHLSTKARDALTLALGDSGEKSDVFVNVELDFDKIVKQTENVVPADEGGNVLKRRESSSKSGATKDSRKSTASTEVEYMLGKEVQEVIKAPGTIRRLSVALVIPQSVTEEEAVSLRELIQKVVGYDQGRGDQITVSRVAEVHGDDEPKIDVVTPTQQGDIKMLSEDNHSSVAQKNVGDITSRTTQNNINNNTLLYGVILLLLLTMLLSYRIGIKAAKTPKNLSPEQREAILEEMSAWVHKRQQAPQ